MKHTICGRACRGLLLAAVVFLATPRGVRACPDEWDDPACNDGDWRDGYWWPLIEGGVDGWVPGMVSTWTWFTPAPVWTTGYSVWYAPGVMEATAAYRGLSLEGYLDGVAMPNCADIGLDVWLRRAGMDWEGPYLVADCARRNDVYGVVVLRHEAVEVGFRTAVRWGMARGRAGDWHALRWRESVEVSKLPPTALAGRPVEYRRWWLSVLTFAEENEPRPVYRAPSTWRLYGETWVTFEQPTQQPVALQSIRVYHGVRKE